MDANNNLDFSDDERLEFDTVLTMEERFTSFERSPFFIVHFEYFHLGEVRKREAIVKIQPFVVRIPPVSDPYEDLLFTLHSFEDQKGNFEMDGYQVYLQMEGIINPNYKSSTVKIYNIQSENLAIPEYPYLGFGQSFFLGEKKIDIDSFDFVRNELILKKSASPDDRQKYGGLPGMTAPPLVEKDIYGAELDLASFRKKKQYVLMNFWGTWCGPCKADHPKLKELYKAYGKKVNFVGIAVDRDVQQVLDYVKENGIEWRNIFFDMANVYEKSSLPAQFNTRAYPTYLLIDGEGKIVARAELEEIARYLDKKK